jgi:hypothetical protein
LGGSAIASAGQEMVVTLEMVDRTNDEEPILDLRFVAKVIEESSHAKIFKRIATCIHCDPRGS